MQLLAAEGLVWIPKCGQGGVQRAGDIANGGVRADLSEGYDNEAALAWQQPMHSKVHGIRASAIPT
jgi:hypothetical protein